MTSFRLPTSGEKADFVLNQFDRIARRYDLTNDAISLGMHRNWKRRAVDELACRPEGSYLDVCCGTGDLALRVAERLSGSGKVTGLDFSGNMLEVARSRGQRSRGRYNCALELVQGDAQQLPFDNSTFDGAIISFGLRNLTDLQLGINEMARVVKSGGRVVNLDVGHPTMPVFTQAFNAWFSCIVPIIGQVLQNDRKAYTYLPESAKAYPKPDEITRMFERAGMKDVRHIPLAVDSVALHAGTVI